ncbi:MAG: arylesterase [Magnetococcales bacterium]|nr:arylesterase [Magnetococcales bacterium]
MARFGKRGWGWLLVLLIGLGGCDDVQQGTALKEDAVILAFGDSLTYGTGAGSGESYPEILSGLIKRRVVSSGIPGEESWEGLARLPGVLSRHDPKLLILCHGANDILQGRPWEEITENLNAMIQLAQEQGIQVVLLGVPSFGIPLSTAPFYAQVAEGFQIPLEKEAFVDILLDPSMKTDWVHPNAKGYRALARAVAKLLRRHGLIV